MSLRPSLPGLRGLAAVLFSLLLTLPAHAGQLLVDILDVGQGDAALLRSADGKTILIDAGTGRTDVLAELQGRGITQIDLAIGTHPHADHIGGMEDVLRALPVGVYMDNGVPHTSQLYMDLMASIEELGIPYMEAEAGQQIQFGEEASIEVLWPTKTKLRGTRSDLNANSVVLRLVHGDNCFLFVGDAEEETEVRLQVRGLEACDVLKVAHHGSDHSSTDRFLGKLQPTIAVISVGEHNRYNHPGEETLRRLDRKGARVYRTDQHGAMRFVSDGRTIQTLEGIATVRTSIVAPPAASEQEQQTATPAPAYGALAGAAYVASRKSEFFHDPHCEWALKISPGNLIRYTSFDEAEQDRRRPAPCCNPSPEDDR